MSSVDDGRGSSSFAAKRLQEHTRVVEQSRNELGKVNAELKQLKDESANLRFEKHAREAEMKSLEGRIQEMGTSGPQQEHLSRGHEIDDRQNQIAHDLQGLEAKKADLELQIKRSEQVSNHLRGEVAREQPATMAAQGPAVSERKVTLTNETERTVKREAVPGGSRQQQEAGPVRQVAPAAAPKSKAPDRPTSTPTPAAKTAGEWAGQTKRPAVSPPAPTPKPATNKPKGPKI